MNYRLYLDRTAHDTYRSMPEDARRRLATMLVDPYAATRPYGIGDDEEDVAVRLLTSDDLVVVLLLTATKTVTVLSISYLAL